MAAFGLWLLSLLSIIFYLNCPTLQWSWICQLASKFHLFAWYWYIAICAFYMRKLSPRLSHRNSVRPSVCLSVTWVDQSKMVQARITKFSPPAARNSSFRNHKAFPEIWSGSPRTRALNERGGGKNLWFLANKSLYRYISITVRDRT